MPTPSRVRSAAGARSRRRSRRHAVRGAVIAGGGAQRRGGAGARGVGDTPRGEGVLGPAAAPGAARGMAPPHPSRWAASMARDGPGGGELAVDFWRSFRHTRDLRHACCPAQPPAWSDSHRAVPPDTSCARPVTQSLSPTQNQWGVAPPSRPRTSRLRLGAAGQSTACSLTPSWCALGPRVRTHTGRSPPVKPFAVV